MKQIEVVIYMALKDQFQEILKEEEIDEYFVIPKALGKLRGSDPRMDNVVWPGYFLLYRFCLEGKKFKTFKERIEEKKKDWIREGFLVTVREIEERCGGSL